MRVEHDILMSLHFTPTWCQKGCVIA